MAIAAADSQAAVLCKKQPAVFTCPIVANMSSNGDEYIYNASNGENEGTWEVSGPWGSAGARIVINGNARCSGTYGSYLDKGEPTPAGDGNYEYYCWCQMQNEGLSSAWVFLNDGVTYCEMRCAFDCAYEFRHYVGFRSALCIT
jgi:hypothetical protein